jgi:hypothetical protein
MGLSNSIESSNKSTTDSDSYFVERLRLMESSVKELNAYSWMPQVKKFINETNQFLQENQLHILVETVILDLKRDRNSKFYGSAISKLTECVNSENPVFSIVEKMESDIWIPLVKKLYEYCSTQKGDITGINPNFTVTKIYSPVEVVNESSYVFHSSGKNLIVTDNNIEITNVPVSSDFSSLVSIIESSKISENQIRMYPNVNSVLDITIGEESKVTLNGKLVESSDLENILLTTGFVKYGDKSRISLMEMAFSRGSEIKEIDFGYSIKSSLFEGVSANVFTINNKIFVQKINKTMNDNSLIECSSATDAVQLVKEFMNYDITDSVKALIENEKSLEEKKTAELSKIQSRIKFIIEKLASIEHMENSKGSSAAINEAKALLNSELNIQNTILKSIQEGVETPFEPSSSASAEPSMVKISTVEDLVAGKGYTVDGQGGYIFQGFTGDSYIFNQKDETNPTPIHMNRNEIESAISSGKITK